MPEIRAGTLSLGNTLVLQQYSTLCCQQSCSHKINPTRIINRAWSERLEASGTADLLAQTRGQRAPSSSRARAFPLLFTRWQSGCCWGGPQRDFQRAAGERKAPWRRSGSAEARSVRGGPGGGSVDANFGSPCCLRVAAFVTNCVVSPEDKASPQSKRSCLNCVGQISN